MASATEISKMQNPSVVLYGPGSANIIDKPIPELSEKDILVRIAFVGVCGSDVSI
jgi:D-xylulose reductase